MAGALPTVPEPGTQVTLRVATPVGPISVVGEVVDADDEWWSVRRRDGSVVPVEVARIEARREVPAGRSATTSINEVQQIAAFGWRAVETVRLGDWLLRSSSGFTQRANSVLAVGDPGVSLDAALDTVTGWYAERGLRPLVMQSPASPAGLVDQLVERGWTAGPDVQVMTGEIAHALQAMPDAVGAAIAAGLELRFDERPDDSWYACYGESGPNLTDAGRAVVEGHPATVFASLREGGAAVAVARAAVDARWAGLFAVAVLSRRRRGGLGAAVTLATLKEAARRGGRHVYLQVEARNEPAIALYRRLNLKPHHDYRYWAARSK